MPKEKLDLDKDIEDAKKEVEERKKKSKNTRHQIHNSHGPKAIISHYAEGIIKELKRLELI